MMKPDDYVAKDLGVRVKVAYANMSVGRVIFPGGIERDLLVKKGFVERITDAFPHEQEPAKVVAKMGVVKKAL